MAEIAHYRLNENAANGTITDALGNYDGTLNVNTNLRSTTGRFEGAINFTGSGASSDYVDLTDTEGFEFGTSDFTISAWVKPTVFDTFKMIFSKYVGAGDQREFMFYIDSNQKLNLQTADDSGVNSDLVTSTGNVNAANIWTHVAVVKSGTTSYLYINGSLDTTGTASADIQGGTAKAYIGAVDTSSTSPDYGFEGVIDELRVFNTALTADEVRFIASHSDSLDAYKKGGRGTSAINTNYPVTEGLTARTTKQTGRQTNLVPTNKSLVSRNDRTGL